MCARIIVFSISGTIEEVKIKRIQIWEWELILQGTFYVLKFRRKNVTKI